MRALVDTQALIWFRLGDERLPTAVRTLFTSDKDQLVLSAASAWEIVIKQMLGKLDLGESGASFVQRCTVDLALEHLPLQFSHVFQVESLAPLHGDPFDRMLAAQAMAERLPVVTGDRAIAQYGVETIW